MSKQEQSQDICKFCGQPEAAHGPDCSLVAVKKEYKDKFGDDDKKDDRRESEQLPDYEVDDEAVREVDEAVRESINLCLPEAYKRVGIEEDRDVEDLNMSELLAVRDAAWDIYIERTKEYTEEQQQFGDRISILQEMILEKLDHYNNLTSILQTSSIPLSEKQNIEMAIQNWEVAINTIKRIKVDYRGFLESCMLDSDKAISIKMMDSNLEQYRSYLLGYEASDMQLNMAIGIIEQHANLDNIRKSIEK